MSSPVSCWSSCCLSSASTSSSAWWRYVLHWWRLAAGWGPCESGCVRGEDRTVLTENAEVWSEKQINISALSQKGKAAGLQSQAHPQGCRLLDLPRLGPISIKTNFVLRNGSAVIWKHCFIASFPCSFTSQILEGNCNLPNALGIHFPFQEKKWPCIGVRTQLSL